MGLFDSIVSALGLGYSVFKDQHLTGAQREANQFTSQENAIARQFNASQAQQQMDFQERMANSQYQRGVSDMQAAGLNPALAYSQGGAVAPSGAAATSGAGSSVDPGRGLSMSDIIQLAQLPSIIKKNSAEADEMQSRSELNRSSAEMKQAELKVFTPKSELEMKNLESDLKSKEVERELKKSHISLNEADAALKSNQAILSGIDVKYRDELNALENKVRIASLGLTAVQSEETRKRIEVYDAQITELLQRSITEAAQANLFDEEARNQLIQQGILEFDKEAKEYQVSKKKLTYTLDCIGKVFGAISSAATTFGALGIGAKAFGSLGSSGSMAGSSLWTPSSINAFNTNYGMH